MSYSFEYIDIILLAMIAGFIFLRLRGILGKRTGFEGKPPSQFEKILNKIGLKTITNNFGSFEKGKERDIIEISNSLSEKLKFLPLICYEVIYSGNLSKNYDFDFIVNISEDGWFGKSIGPEQHFVHSIFRAIETGKYILRSSNNGISAIINPLGQIEKQIKFGNSGYIDFEEKKDLNKTIFSIYGNKIFMILILFCDSS